MVRHFLISLSFLNQTPFTTFSRFVSEARLFEIKPPEFDELLDILVRGKYQELRRLEEIAVSFFSHLENIYEDMGLELYDDKIDLN